MARLHRPTLRQLARYGFPAKNGPGDPITRRTLYPNSASSGGSTFDISTSERVYFQTTSASLGTTLSNVALIAPGTNGTASAFQDTTGHYINYLSATTLSSPAGWTSFGTDTTQRQLLPDVTWVVKTGAGATDIANVILWAYLVDVSGTVTANSVPNQIGFRFRPENVGEVNWQCISTNGAGTLTTTNSGVVVTANTKYIFRLRFSDINTLEYYINGTLVATHTSAGSNLPATTVGLGHESYAINRTAGTARNWRINQIKGTHL